MNLSTSAGVMHFRSTDDVRIGETTALVVSQYPGRIGGGGAAEAARASPITVAAMAVAEAFIGRTIIQKVSQERLGARGSERGQGGRDARFVGRQHLRASLVIQKG